MNRLSNLPNHYLYSNFHRHRQIGALRTISKRALITVGVASIVFVSSLLILKANTSPFSPTKMEAAMPTENTHNIYNQYEDFFEMSDGSCATFGEDGGDVSETKTPQKSSNKRGKRSSKKSLSEKKKVRKCSNGEYVSQSEEPNNPKKFSHSTRRKAKRQFDRTLLTIPDDQIDHPNIPFRDLIRLAEYNEGGEMPKKDDEGQGGTPADQSFGGDYHNDGFDTYDNMEEEVKEGENATVVGASILNYHTFMERTFTSRWSKQETVLFYEGVRQFGADISMIQQLFPDRTRRQVKLKYKKEGRRYPQRLDDALMHRSKDVSHFEQVIQRLRQTPPENAVSENENVEDKEAGTTGFNESAQQDDASHGGRSGGVVETEESLLHGDEVDGGSIDMDDDFFYSQYRSD